MVSSRSSRSAALLALACLASELFASACGSSTSDSSSAPGGASGATAGSAGTPSVIAGASSAAGAAGSVASAAGGSGLAGLSGSAGSVAANGGNPGTAGTTAGSGGAGAAGADPTGFQTWPGGNAVITVDPANTYASDLSGLHYEPAQGATPAVLWAVQNLPSKLYRLLWNGTVWASDPSNGWASGKTLHFPNGQGAPDSEGVTQAALGSTGLYTSIERDNDVGNVSRLSVLLFDGSSAGATLTATREWDLTSDIPKTGANLGLEAVTFVPDTYLVAKGFLDESKNAAYNPANYPNHAAGLFFVGVEATGVVYAFALDHVGGGFTRVATIESGNSGVMDLSFDRDVGYLWAVCDDTCQGRTNVLEVDTRAGSSTQGKFHIRRGFERPATMANLNNEGFTVTTESTCQAGFKYVYYAEDGSTNGHAIRRDSIPCGPFL